MFWMLMALVLQDPVTGIILSDDPPPPAVPSVQRPISDLPARALEDPFGWERSQCHSLIRKDEPLDVCQVRVRSDLLGVLGARLPAALHPRAGLEHCSAGNAANNFRIQCRSVSAAAANGSNRP